MSDRHVLFEQASLLDEIIERHETLGLQIHTAGSLEVLKALKAIIKARDFLLIAIGKLIEEESVIDLENNLCNE